MSTHVFFAGIAGKPSAVKVIYCDEYPAAKISVNASGQSFSIAMQGTKRWQTAFAPDARGADVTAQCADQDITLHMVEVTRGAIGPASK